MRRGFHKFGAVRSTDSQGRSFASKGERACFEYLQSLQGVGRIADLKCQVTVYLTLAKIKMIPDFAWIDHAGFQCYGEYKGYETPEYRIKRRLWKFYGPGPLHVYTGFSSRGPNLKEIIEVVGNANDP